MSGSDVEMQDAQQPQLASTIKRYFDLYDVPIRMGPSLLNFSGISWDRYGNKLKDGKICTNDASTQSEETKASSDECMQNGKGKTAKGEASLGSVLGGEDTYFELFVYDKGDGSFVDIRTNIPDDVWCGIAEGWAFDDFDKAVKSIFFTRSRLTRGREFLCQSQRFEEALGLARDGDVEVMQALISVVIEMSPQQALAFFKVMIHKIEGMAESSAKSDETSPETTKEPGNNQEPSKPTNPYESLIVPIVIGIAHMLQVFHGEELNQLLSVGWNALITYCLDLVKMTTPVKGPLTNANRKFHHTFRVILEKGTRDESILYSVRHDRELLRYIAKSWSNDSPFDEEDAYSTAVLLRIGKDSKAMAKLVNLIQRAHEGFEDATAEHIIRRIDVTSDLSVHLPGVRRAMQEGIDDPLTYRRLFFELKWMLRLLTSKHDPDARQPQLAKNSLYTRLILDDFFGEVTRVVGGKFVDRFPSPGSPFRPSAVACALVLNTFYADSFQRDPFGSVVLPRALEQGYITHIMKLSAHIIPEDSSSDLCNTLERIVGLIIPCFFIRSDIIELAVEGFRKAYQQDIWDRIMASPLAGAWKKLKAVLLEREAHKQLYEKLKKENKHMVVNMCSFCMSLKDNFKLMRCAGCKIVYYCSKACQVKAWKSEHKMVCKAFEAAAVSNALDNMQFQGFCARRDIARHRPGLEKKVTTICKENNELLSPVSAEIDYSSVPMRIILKAEENTSKRIPKGVLTCKYRCLPGVDIIPLDIHLPLNLLKGGEQQQSDEMEMEHTSETHRLCAQDEEGKPLDTVAWDIFDQHILENGFEFAPLPKETETCPQDEPREQKMHIFNVPVIPREYEDSSSESEDDDSEEEGTMKVDDKKTEVPKAGLSKVSKRRQGQKKF